MVNGRFLTALMSMLPRYLQYFCQLGVPHAPTKVDWVCCQAFTCASSCSSMRETPGSICRKRTDVYWHVSSSSHSSNDTPTLRVRDMAVLCIEFEFRVPHIHPSLSWKCSSFGKNFTPLALFLKGELEAHIVYFKYQKNALIPVNWGNFRPRRIRIWGR